VLVQHLDGDVEAVGEHALVHGAEAAGAELRRAALRVAVYPSSCCALKRTGFSRAISLRKFSMVVLRITESGSDGGSPAPPSRPVLVVLTLMDGRPFLRKHR